MDKIAVLSAFFPSTATGATTFESTAYHIPSVTLMGNVAPMRIVDLQVDLISSAEPVVWLPVDDLGLSVRSLQLLEAGIVDVKAGRVRKIDLNEFDDE